MSLRFAVALTLAAATASAQQLEGPFTAESFPTELPLRPLTLPAGLFEVRLDGEYGSVSGFTLFGPVEVTALSVAPGLAYGLTDRAEVGVQVLTAFLDSSFGDSEMTVLPALTAGYSFVDTPTVDFAGRIRFLLNPERGAAQLTVGGPVRFAFGDRFALSVGDRLLSAMPAGGYLLSLPVLAQAQLLSSFAGELETTLGAISFGRSEASFEGPSNVRAALVFATRSFDLRVGTTLAFPGSEALDFALAGGAAFRF